jgi:signal transduction histidine kinase
MLEILTQKHLSQEDIKNMQNFVSLMATELERCGHIVSGLLSFARETPLEYKSIDMNEILEAVISLTRHKMELQGIELRCRMPQGILPIRGDANRMQQCILNLIFNAIESMPEGGKLSIEARRIAEEDWCRIKVSDSGCGIPDQDLGHIFEPFFTTKPEGQGTGLGLSIVYGVVKNHKGVVSVESTVGKGTHFELKLPLSPDLP